MRTKRDKRRRTTRRPPRKEDPREAVMRDLAQIRAEQKAEADAAYEAAIAAVCPPPPPDRILFEMPRGLVELAELTATEAQWLFYRGKVTAEEVGVWKEANAPGRRRQRRIGPATTWVSSAHGDLLAALNRGGRYGW